MCLAVFAVDNVYCVCVSPMPLVLSCYRSLLRSFSDEQYEDIKNVCSMLPVVQMTARAHGKCCLLNVLDLTEFQILHSFTCISNLNYLKNGSCYLTLQFLYPQCSIIHIISLSSHNGYIN